MIEYRDIYEADTPDRLNEASLGRIYQHYKNSGGTSFAILTSWRLNSREGKSHAAWETGNTINGNNFDALKQMLSSWRLGYFRQSGHSMEVHDGQKIDVTEPSLFVTGISLKQALHIKSKFSQDSILYSGEDTQGNVIAYEGEGNTPKNLGVFTPKKISDYYSAVKGHPYVFEAAPFGYLEGMCGARGFKIIPGINRIYHTGEKARTAKWDIHGKRLNF